MRQVSRRQRRSELASLGRAERHAHRIARSARWHRARSRWPVVAQALQVVGRVDARQSSGRTVHRHLTTISLLLVGVFECTAAFLDKMRQELSSLGRVLRPTARRSVQGLGNVLGLSDGVTRPRSWHAGSVAPAPRCSTCCSSQRLPVLLSRATAQRLDRIRRRHLPAGLRKRTAHALRPGAMRHREAHRVEQPLRIQPPG